jgi:Rrf2 family iron-sulfur cluster assembly transcriptional regulator
MILSQTAEYALRAMAWLATESRSEPVRARDLSTATGIPTHYLSKVMRRLVLAELLVSQKGQGGGFALAKPPEEIAFMDILAAVDAYPAAGVCAFGWGECVENDPCPLHGSWSRLNEHLQTWAEGTTLAEVSLDGHQVHARRTSSELS